MPEASIPALAIIGMAAMVGGGTGAAMTAVTMLFEMTRDYEIVMPMILAVAVAVGVRRMLSRENIYTIKLVARRHFIPKALHANMFLVRRASEVMDKDILVLSAETRFDDFLKRPEHQGGLAHVVVTDKRPHRRHAARQHRAAARPGGSLHRASISAQIAQRNFTIARDDDIAYEVIRRMWRRSAAMAVVVAGDAPHPASRRRARQSSPRNMSPIWWPTASFPMANECCPVHRRA